MLCFDNGGCIVEEISELPSLVGARDLFLDLETTSGHKSLTSLNPWHSCNIAGICITVDDARNAWYVPVGHHFGNNLDPDKVYAWLFDIVDQCKRWINHNVKYDANVLANCAGILADCALVDTTTLSKIIDSDRMLRGGYGLDALSKGWLREDIKRYEDRLQPYLHKNKDYGAIPIDILGEYGCQDVLTNRRLFHYIDAQCPEQCRRVWNTEIKLTSVLMDVEREGLLVDPTELRLRELQILNELTRIDSRLTQLVGRSFSPTSSDDCYDVLCCQYGLPILKWTEEKEDEDDPNEEQPGNPSFDKHAMAAYVAHPYAPKEVVELISRYRKLSTHKGLFVTKYQELHIDSRLHGSYNQTVRTGRMSMKNPNAQQLDKMAKELIHPGDGMSFLSFDYSQIEFRTIVHYIQDRDAIRAYNQDPDTDFHQWVADMCGMKRRPAKTVNFMVAFGGGKKKTQKTLSANMDIVASLKDKVEELITSGKVKREDELPVFNILCQRKAAEVYETYHAKLPGIKRTSRAAAEANKQRGYVFNRHGRRRHLPEDKSHIAFNTLNQSEAADIMKERAVELHAALKGTPIKISAFVHDETLMRGPTEVMTDPRTINDVAALLESIDPLSDPLAVPIRTAYGHSNTTWRAASEMEMKAPKWESFGNFSHIK